MSGNPAPHKAVFLVQRIAAGDDRHQAAGYGNVDGFAEEVIVDASLKPFILDRTIYDRIIAEGNVRDHQIELIGLHRGIFKATDKDAAAFCIGVQ